MIYKLKDTVKSQTGDQCVKFTAVSSADCNYRVLVRDRTMAACGMRLKRTSVLSVEQERGKREADCLTLRGKLNYLRIGRSPRSRPDAPSE